MPKFNRRQFLGSTAAAAAFAAAPAIVQAAVVEKKVDLVIVGGGLAYTWQRTWLKIAGTCGLLGAAITLHAIYNLLIAYGGAAQYIAYALPVLLVAAGRLSVFRLSRRK